MSAAFTPGPWTFERINYDHYGKDASYEVKAGFRAVVQTHMREIGKEAGWLAEDEANARLIAAAPEMFKALAKVITGATLLKLTPEAKRYMGLDDAASLLAEIGGEA